MLPYKSDVKYYNSIDLNSNGIMLPSYPELTEKQISKICDLVKKVIDNEP
jgi:dTDP-4-amino-4,6-dideoxygalactose transaminase